MPFIFEKKHERRRSSLSRRSCKRPLPPPLLLRPCPAAVARLLSPPLWPPELSSHSKAPLPTPWRRSTWET